MYHTIQFTMDMPVDLEFSARQRLARVLIKKGTRLQAQLRPYVVDTGKGLIETADLFFIDGCATRAVPFACFFFVE